MSLTNLLNIMLSPKNIKERPMQNDWDESEKKLGTVFPDDYKKFLDFYGTGQICDFIYVLNPISSFEALNLFIQRDWHSNSVKIEREEFKATPIYTIFPDNGGLLPCGIDDNGNSILWLATGNPNQWKIVVSEGRGPDYEVFDLTLTEFLFDVLTKKIRLKIYPVSFPSSKIYFKTL